MNSSCCVICELNWIVFMAIVKHFRVKMRLASFCCVNLIKYIKGVVSKATVVLRRWASSIQKFGFINGVDNVNWPPYRDSKS